MGSWSSRAASLSHIAVLESTGPIDRYSAMPSMNHRGSRFAPRVARRGPGARRDIELKGMNELVADDVIGVGQRPAERQDDPPPQRFGDAARAFAELPLNRVGLFEVRMRRVEDERLASPQLMAEQALETGQPSLGHTRGDVDPFTLVWIEVDVEMLGLENLEIELLVLNLVAAEVLRGRCEL